MRAGISIILFSAPLTAFADESGELVRRDQCQPLYTVQKRGCVAEHVMRCEVGGDLFYRSDTIQDGELTDIEFSDADFEFVSSWNVDGMNFLLEMIDNRDPFSLSTLVVEGIDGVDQTVLVNPAIVAPREADFVGSSALTGVVQSIDGSEVENIALVGSLDLGTTVWEISGDMYLDQQTQTLFYGTAEFVIEGQTQVVPGDPVKILRKGDVGFMKDITIFDCGEES